MKKITLSIEQMRRLQNLGVDTSDASMVLLFITEEGEYVGWDEVQDNGKDCQFYQWYNPETEIWESTTIELLNAETGNYDHSYKECCGAFTLQDILEIMPVLYPTMKNGKRILVDSSREDSGCHYQPTIFHSEDGWFCSYFDSDELLDERTSDSYDNPLDAAYDMLCWLCKNNYLPLKNKSIIFRKEYL